MGSGSANLGVSQTMEEFKDFQRYVKGVDPYGMQSGIVVIDPPEEWYVNAWPIAPILFTEGVANCGCEQETSPQTPR